MLMAPFMQEAIMSVSSDRQVHQIEAPTQKGTQYGTLTADRANMRMDEMNKLFAPARRPLRVGDHDSNDFEISGAS